MTTDGSAGRSRRRAAPAVRRPSVVADVMRTDVVTAAAGLSLRDFVRLLSDEGISGTPVVDAGGRVVGVASHADVVRAARRQTESALGGAGVAGGGPGPSPCAHAAAGDRGEGPPDYFRAPARGPELVEALHHEELPADLGSCTVEDVMTPALFWVRPDASLAEAAALLAEGHVHRALVFEGDQLVGLVTAFDLLAALSRGGAPAEGG